MIRDRFPDAANLRIQLLDGNGLTNIADGTIDKIVSLGVFVHLDPWDLYMYLAEIRRVMKSGGLALIEYPNTFTEFGWQRFMFDVERNVNMVRRSNSFVPMDVPMFTNYAEKAGLEVMSTDKETIPRNAVTTLRRLPSAACKANG